ncbi:hypothetical protein D5086_027731 [Populus alba]|uniref:Uncharacterized protein n=1 Tax=Populus alba TaxID=43335 RepID=A0ACC4AW88_POPAL
MIVVVVILRILLFDHAPNIAKLLNMTRNSDGALLMKPKLFLSFFQQQDTLSGYLSALSSPGGGGGGGGGLASEYGNSNGVYPHSPFLHNPENKRENQRNSKRNFRAQACFLFLFLHTKFLDIGYKKTREKGQGSEAEMASLKRVKEESVRDLGELLMIYENQRRTT